MHFTASSKAGDAFSRLSKKKKKRMQAFFLFLSQCRVKQYGVAFTVCFVALNNLQKKGAFL